MSETTVARRDIGRIWEQLERLFDWAGTRNAPMAPANLAALRQQVTQEINQIMERADALEQVPVLREVSVDEKDGMRTVVIDMRDGTTRSFQTRVDWFDRSPGLPETATALIAEAQATAEEQRTIAEREAAKARENIVDTDAFESRIRELMIRAEQAESDLLDERRLKEMNAKLLDESRARTTESEERVRTLTPRITELTARAERAERNLIRANALHETHAEQLATETDRANSADGRFASAEAERVEWRNRWQAETKVVNEALPKLAELLTERTKASESIEAAAGKAAALLALKRYEKDEKAVQAGQALRDALALRTDRG